MSHGPWSSYLYLTNVISLDTLPLSVRSRSRSGATALMVTFRCDLQRKQIYHFRVSKLGCMVSDAFSRSIPLGIIPPTAAAVLQPEPRSHIFGEALFFMSSPVTVIKSCNSMPTRCRQLPTDLVFVKSFGKY